MLLKSKKIVALSTLGFLLLTGCLAPDPDHIPKTINASCVKPLNGVASIHDIDITSDGLKAIVVYSRNFDKRMFIADLSSATVIKKYYAPGSESSALQYDVQWMTDSTTKFWGVDAHTIAEMDDMLRRSNQSLCEECYGFSISKQSLFATLTTTGSMTATTSTVTVYDRIGGQEILSRTVSGYAPMGFSPDSRYLSVYQNGQKFIDLKTGRLLDAPPNLMKYAWIDNSTVLIPDESQPVIWAYNVETKAKREYLRLSLREGQANPEIAGVSGNGAMQYLVIWASYGDLHVVDVDCQRKLSSQ